MRPRRPEHAAGVRIDHDRSACCDRRAERPLGDRRPDQRGRRANRLRRLRLRSLDVNALGLRPLRSCVGGLTVGRGRVERERRSPGGKRRNDDDEERRSTPAYPSASTNDRLKNTVRHSRRALSHAREGSTTTG
jgi:hypothetical protein